MKNEIEKLTNQVQELQLLINEVPWSEKHKIIEIKDKAKLLAEFAVNDEKAIEVKTEIEEFTKTVDQLIVDLKNELKIA